MSTKKKATQEQPAAAPAVTAETALAPNGNAIDVTPKAEETAPVTAQADEPKKGVAQEAAPAAEQPAADQPEDERITVCRRLLQTYPTLDAGYICEAGTYFDEAIAKKKLAKGEELIIVTREKK